jgi:hypothetical protein
MARRGPIVKAVIVAAWLVFLLTTNLRYGWDRSNPDFPLDVFGYERIADAAPGFPDRGLDPQHAQRWVPHYIVGVAADVTSVSVRHITTSSRPFSSPRSRSWGIASSPVSA